MIQDWIPVPDWVCAGGVDRVRRARLLLAITALMLPLGVALAVLCWVLSSPFVGGSILVVCVLGALVPVVMNRSKSVSLAGIYLSLILWIVTVIVTATTGGPHGEAIYFFILPPVLAVILSGQRAGIGFTAASLTGVVGFEIIELAGYTPTNLVPDDQFILDLGGRVILVIIVVSIGLMYEAFKEYALGELGRLNGELSSEVARHHETQANLERTHHALVDAARQAGMAQVAAGVLHNVGNALNSVNVSTTRVQEGLGGSHVERLRRLAQRLETSELPHDKVAEFLASLSSALDEQLASAREEADSIRVGVDHISHIIERQQAVATRATVAQSFDWDAAVAEAVRLAQAKPSASNAQFEISSNSAGSIRTDRHRVLEILVNLLVNAAEAAKSVSDRPMVRVVTETLQSGHLSIRVSDNGCGFEPERAASLFSFGFTTKAEGHGFGLHASANAAVEIGGKITAESPGIGRGATFTLTLPQKQAELSSASVA